MQAVFAISPFSVQFYSILERFTPILFCLPLFPQKSLEPNGANELWGLTQIGHKILNIFYLIVEQIVDCEFEGVAGYVENERFR